MKQINKMKKYLFPAVVALVLGNLCSCVKNEALNAEADILSCTLPEEILLRDPVISDASIVVYVKSGTDVSALAPEFTISAGASIYPASGTVRNFSQPQVYTVTSEDGKWSKEYTVSVISPAGPGPGPDPDPNPDPDPDPSVNTTAVVKYHFDVAEHNTDNTLGGGGNLKYDVFKEDLGGGNILVWGSGNAGFALTNSSAASTAYPTCISDDGYSGKCVKLETRSTGTFGSLFGAPMAAGNIFTGTFEMNLTNTSKSTHMGIPFLYEPLSLSGWYKYTAGAQFTNKGTVVEGRTDLFDVYAVLFEVTSGVQYLDGTNSLTSANIVKAARLPQEVRQQNKAEWTHFEIQFDTVEGRSIDYQKLASGSYSLVIVMSSSEDGANFNGAIGSVLYADELELTYDTTQKARSK